LELLILKTFRIVLEKIKIYVVAIDITTKDGIIVA